MSWQGKGKIAFVGVGFSSIERSTDRSIGEFAEEAIQNALNDAGLRSTDIDGLATFPEPSYAGALQRDGVDMISPEWVLANCSPGDVKWFANLNDGMVTAAIVESAMALLGGACNYALVWRAMHHPKRSSGRREVEVSNGDDAFSEPFGCVSGVQWHALAYRRYLERYGQSREGMASLVMNSRHNANLNKNAFFHDKLMSQEDYLKARMISDPLCLLDCDIPIQSCMAMIMTTSERARDLKNKPAYLGGFSLNAMPRQPMLNYTFIDYLEVGGLTASQLWSSSGIGPHDISAAMLYDGFAPSTLYWLEAAGFCKPGEAMSFIKDGRIAIGGELPINTFGGSLSQGRMHGMGHATEAVLQASGRAGLRQVRDRSAICVFSGSPMYRGSGLIFTSEP